VTSTSRRVRASGRAMSRPVESARRPIAFISMALAGPGRHLEHVHASDKCRSHRRTVGVQGSA
jgi:hypothetical protein